MRSSFRTRVVLGTSLGLALLTAGPTIAQKPGDPGMVKFRGASFPVAEEAGEVTIVVKRQRGSTGAVTVEYATAAGSAVAGEDYEDVAGTLSWDDGDRSDKTFTVPILDDDLDEGQETFGIQLSNPTGDLEIGNPNTTVVRIKPSDRSDDEEDGEDGEEEDGAGIVKLTATSFPAFENAGVATFAVERDEGGAGAASVDYMTMDGSATDGADYAGVSGTLSWADGELGEKTVDVPLLDDTDPESDETITVVLTNPTGGVSLGVRDSASIVIVDDDGGAGLCVPDEETLCLQDGRFQVTGTWRDFDGNEGPFHFLPSTDDAGLVWFFDEANVELLVKVLMGCPINGHIWVFFAAATNLGFTMEVSDLEAGLTRVYENPVGVVPLATTDVTAFASCP